MEISMGYLLRLLPAAVLVVTVALAACDDGGGSTPTPSPTASPVATASPSPTPSPTPTLESEPTGAVECPLATESDGMEGFRAFVTCIADSLVAGGGTALTDRALQDEITCAGDEQLGPCVDRPAGTVLRGIFSGIAQSDAITLLSPTKYAALFTRWASDAQPGESDSYGDGGVAVHALAHRPASGQSEEVYQVILTAIAAPSERQARVLSFRFQDGRWRFTADLIAEFLGTAEPFLTGDCAYCGYDVWERWEGSAS
ncbi:MAG: hypothetical protein ACE5KW_01580 [Dehalococcoidia bacterium]